MGSPAPAAHPALPPFNPPPELTDQILDDLADPDTTLRAIAHRHGASLESLTLWLARPDIAERVALIESAVARRTRLVATNFLPSAVKTAARILDEYHDEESHVPVRPADLQSREQRRRSRETARRAAALLLRLARFEPVTSTGTGPRPVSPRATDRPESSEARRCDRASACPATPAPTPPDLRCEISNLKSPSPAPTPEECHGQGVPAPLAPDTDPRTPADAAPASPVPGSPPEPQDGHPVTARGAAPGYQHPSAQSPEGALQPNRSAPLGVATPPSHMHGTLDSPSLTANHTVHPPPPVAHGLSPP